jgi:osmotically inducible lipoprotein OsmB
MAWSSIPWAGTERRVGRFKRDRTAIQQLPLEESKMRVHAAKLVVLTGLGLALAGCGYSRGDRALSGGLLGAGAGAGVAALTGGAPLAGATIGGAAGAIGGAVTSGHDINLGRPIWR